MSDWLRVSHPSQHRSRFFGLLGINLCFAFILLRRTYGGLCRYGILFAISQVFPLPFEVTAPALGWALLGNILLDLFIFVTLFPIVLDFTRGPAMFRLRYGFPQEEVVFRRPTLTTMVNIAAQAPQKKDTFLKDLLRRAVDPEEMNEINFGFPWEEWAYDYKANDSCVSKTWDVSTWIKMKSAWSVIQQNSEVDYEMKLGMMEKLKDKLREMGQEQVFMQMTEVIRAHTVYTDGVPQPVPAEVDNIISDIFKRNDLDFGGIMRDYRHGYSAEFRDGVEEGMIDAFEFSLSPLASIHTFTLSV
ncbi:hypothetical protein F5J12DRAFT_943949 [Pisolithus orientalis]|uniref:uncharacterized protein n=1 Tax=Pisolithus orientalis TaxID=936130 RepID=UPI002224FCA4|nr:uncharacterized protein F5J12DRAFT_943949 [Pisolithus orientalis]KAI6003211.1 hypothetical protein F5J12DRAFT_943949 [Pisolithus orientalis]